MDDLLGGDPLTAEVNALEAELMKAAEVASGLSDWGPDQNFKVGFRLVLRDFLDLPGAQRDGLHGMLANWLVQRLQLAADARREPEMLAQSIERPVFVIGMARTGTTHLHKLLSLCPDARYVTSWESAFPSPPTEAGSFTTDPRIAQTQAGIAEFLKLVPQMEVMHPLRPADPVECEEMLCHQFTGTLVVWAFYPLPRFAKWTASGASAGLYAAHRRLLQQFQWRGPKGRWTLKSPTHLFTLPALLEAYPDACMIQTHREPARCFPSHSSMVSALRKLGNPAPDLRKIGREVIETWGPVLEKSTQDRADPKLDGRILDVSYTELAADPVGVVRRIHRHFDLNFSETHADRIRDYVAADAKRRATAHRYEAADFGLDAADLAQDFPAYRARFGQLLA